MPGLRAFPLLVILMALTALAMLMPAAHAYASGDPDSGRPFFYGAIMMAVLTAMIGLATMGRSRSETRHAPLRAMVLAYLVLPPLMALPFHQALGDTSFGNAWFEMLSSFTTTGATVYDVPGRLSDSLHLWRALIGWLGGFFVLVMAVAVLMPLNLGGMEVLSGRTGAARARQITHIADMRERMGRFAQLLLPPYAGFTLVLWLALVMVGETGFDALCLAMATVSTSGILPDPALAGQVGAGAAQVGLASGMAGEMLIAVLLCLGITRRAYPGALFGDADLPLRRDPEIHLALAIVLGVTLVLFLRHWVGAIEQSEGGDWSAFMGVLWANAFTTLSFLTTTGIPSGGWSGAQDWSGLEAHGVILMGLAIIGGGVATTAGGVKLLRVYALFRHGQREMERLIHPHSVSGGGPLARQLRGEGAQMAWVFFMMFALSILAITGALTLTGLHFDPALILSVSALTTTGPLAALAGETPVRYAELGGVSQAILGVAMVLGRVEALAILAMLAPDTWRR
ncbi:TrkH family potassium uptake protein [Gemmobacter serpentinus]|uniref:TrkH family potassium uptake protein n=1 Tax=Gemmobacter serpentinus TaxID=2652247 RepID=UPI00124F0714|nr:potassium transporter TrkG [Gemmobacter serpentinus]